MSIKKQIDSLKNMGLNIMPLQAYSKSPLADWKRLQTEMYVGTYPDNCNIGVICGKISGNVFVIDIDEPTLYSEFSEYHDKTYIVQTGKRGFHIYLRSDGALPANKKFDDPRGRHIDIKSEGGYVLGAGSIHPDTKKEYIVICNKPILTIDPITLRDKLIQMGFSIQGAAPTDAENGVKEGGRNNAMFKYGCYLVREKQLYGAPLLTQMQEANQKNEPPLSEGEIKLIIAQVEKYEGKNVKVMKELISLDNFKDDVKALNGEINLKSDLKKYVKALGEDRVKAIIKDIDPTAKISEAVPKISMQDIDPKEHEGVEISFDASVLAVGEMQTYTSEADVTCSQCCKTEHVECDVYHVLKIPYCTKHKKDYEIIPETKKTTYIQQMRVSEFLEVARNGSPREYDAEIIDENVGEAFMNDRMTFTARFRSIPPKDPMRSYNHIVFQISKMVPLEQQHGCMPEQAEINKWKADPDIYKRVVDSIAPELYMQDEIIESAMLAITGGMSLNGKRSRVHMGIIGDAMLGKSELFKFLHIITPGSGLTVGTQVTGTGLTIGMHKMYNGMMVPMAGFLPTHTGKPIYLDEADKMKSFDQDCILECMEQGTASQAKTGSGAGHKLSADCPVFVAGNPRNGKFNARLPNIMDNFNFSAPFLSRLDILWLDVDRNDELHDEAGIKHVRNFKNIKDNYMSIEELQRYFTYVTSLKVELPEALEPLIDKLYKKMRPLNKKDGLPIGWRQFYGLNRLVTACAADHLRTVVTEEDFRIVENIITKALKSLKMDLETGEVEAPMSKSKDNKEKIFLETWGECQNDNKLVVKDEFLEKLAGKAPYYNALNVGKTWSQYEASGKIQPEEGLYRLVIN